MNEMSSAIERLRFAVHTLPGVLARLSEADSERRPSPERWAKKEAVGHLIDSASNNHQRFVRGQLAAGQDFPRYAQERWVSLQGYQSARWPDLIDLWRAYNTHLLHVTGCMTAEGRRATSPFLGQVKQLTKVTPNRFAGSTPGCRSPNTAPGGGTF